MTDLKQKFLIEEPDSIEPFDVSIFFRGYELDNLSGQPKHAPLECIEFDAREHVVMIHDKTANRDVGISLFMNETDTVLLGINRVAEDCETEHQFYPIEETPFLKLIKTLAPEQDPDLRRLFTHELVKRAEKAGRSLTRPELAGMVMQLMIMLSGRIDHEIDLALSAGKPNEKGD